MDEEGLSPAPPFNPYEPPKAGLDQVDTEPTTQASTPLATLGQRLGGSMVDGFLGLLALAPVFAGLSLEGFARQGRTGNPFAMFQMAGTWGAVAGILTLALWAIQWFLIATRGQTVGKMEAKTRIVRLDGTPVGFARGVALRVWIPQLVGYIPVVGSLLVLIDVLVIFRGDRRCLHDLIADTKVVQAAPPPRSLD